jgi:O-antigen ligase
MSVAAALTGVLTLVLWFRVPGARGERTPVELPAVAWLMALTVSAIFALDRQASFLRLGKALFPALVPLSAFHTSNRKDGERAAKLLLLSSAVASVYGLILFVSRGASFASRARGAVGHYMTFAGQLLLLLSLALGIALLARARSWRLGGLLTALLGTTALACTYTRSAWLGLSAALAVLLVAARPRWIPAFLVGLFAIYLLAPGDYRARLHSVFEPHHPQNRERTLMWEAGARMFRDRPLTGVGLQDLRPIYPRYRSPDARETPGHLHNDYVHIAATMGLAGLAAFAWLFGSLFIAAGARLRPMLAHPDLTTGLRLGVLAGLVGFLVAGLFEWNFGDEELLYLLYVMVGLAWSARRWETGEAAAPRMRDSSRAVAAGPGHAPLPIRSGDVIEREITHPA